MEPGLLAAVLRPEVLTCRTVMQKTDHLLDPVALATVPPES